MLQDQVDDTFSEAMPQLVAIAKAASELNPETGDASYMLQSFVEALRRQRVRIADNLDITIKADVYTKYADALGVEVGELTDDQMKEAFLKAFLEAGSTLVEEAARREQ